MYSSPHRYQSVALLATCISLLTPIFAGSARGDWSQLNGPVPPVVRALADDGTTLYLGNNEGDGGDVFRSTDGGVNWENAGLANGGINFLFPHSSGVYAGTNITGLYRSIDQGRSWTRLTSGLQDGDYMTAFTALGADTLFLGMASSSPRPLYRSVDAGAHWSAVPASPALFSTVLVSTGAMVFAGTVESGLFRSTDRGATWASSSTGLPANAYVGAILFVPGAALLGVTSYTQPSANGIYRSNDSGAHWSRISVDVPVQPGLTFTSLVSRSGALLAGLHGDFGGQGLYRSTDGGVHWTLISPGIPGSPSVDAILEQGTALLAGTPHGVYRTSNDGGSWTYAGRGTAANEGTTALFGESGALYLGTDRMGEQDTGVWRTSDAGEDWAELATGLPFHSTSAAFVRAGGDLLAGMYASASGVYRSSDNGVSWALSSSGIPNSTILRALLQDGNITLAAAYEGLYRSTDGGHAWAAVPGFNDVYSLTSRDGVLYAGSVRLGVRRSTDRGLTWTDFNTGLPGGPGFTVKALCRHAGQLFAVANESSVYRLDGSVWVPAGLTTDFIFDLADAGDALVAGASSNGIDGITNDIFVSTDLGASWTPFGEGYHGDEVVKLSSDGVLLYAGSRAHGIWKRSLAELPTAASAPDQRGDPGTLLLENLPDPFASRTTFSLSSGGGRVSLSVYDVQGREVARPLDGILSSGPHTVPFDAARLSPGVYFYKLQAGGTSVTRRFHIVR